MERSTQKIGLVNFIALLAVGAGVFALGKHSLSLAALAASIALGFGALVAAVGWFQMRLEDRERLEKYELDELARTRGSATLFEGKEDTFAAQQSRLSFEKYFVPGFTLVLCVGQSVVAWWLWNLFAKIPVVAPLQNQLMTMGLFGLCFLALFLLGKYAAGIAKIENLRLIRPSAGWLLLGAYVCFLVAAGIAAEEAGVKRVDFQLARGLAVLLAMLAAELLLNLVFELYRPRVKGKVARPLYESRLVGLLSQPEGLFTTAARTLDYQFGFKVSETFAYQILAEKLPAFILALAAAAWLSSCLVFLEPGEQALLERNGKPVDSGKILTAGAHLKLPWPIDKIYRYNASEVRSFNVGFVPDPKLAGENTVLWTRSHYKEELPFLVASRDVSVDTNANATVPVNLLDAGIPVQFRIADVRAWATKHADAQALLEQIATREVVRYLAGVDLLDIMSTGRAAAAVALQKNIQARADELNLGAEILFVGLADIHPPTTAAADYEAVNGASQQVQAKVFKAEGDATKDNLLAQAQALEDVRAAEGRAAGKVSGANAQAARFANQLVAYRTAPEVYSQRLYLQTFARATANTRKYLIMATNAHEVFQLNLEEKLRPDILDVTAPPPTH
ncbi:MAG: Modulator of FtsH protease HflK [Verrucomicrobiota bacterium]|jgi:regulator of protease activity HflC (stomatin/prohibitin superfamily)